MTEFSQDGMASELASRVQVRREADERFVAAIRVGDTDTFGRLFDAWVDTIHDLLVRAGVSDERAAAIERTVFAEGWRDASRGGGASTFGADVVRHAIRSSRDDRSVVADVTGAHTRLLRATKLGPVAADPGVATMLFEAAEALGETARTLFDLRVRHGLDISEIGEAINRDPAELERLAERIPAAFDAVVRARVIWGDGLPGLWGGADEEVAPVRAALVDAGVEDFGPDAVRVLNRLVHGDDRLRARSMVPLGASAIFAAIPTAGATGEHKRAVAASLADDGVPMGRSEFASRVRRPSAAAASAAAAAVARERDVAAAEAARKGQRTDPAAAPLPTAPTRSAPSGAPAAAAGAATGAAADAGAASGAATPTPPDRAAPPTTPDAAEDGAAAPPAAPADAAPVPAAPTATAAEGSSVEPEPTDPPTAAKAAGSKAEDSKAEDSRAMGKGSKAKGKGSKGRDTSRLAGAVGAAAAADAMGTPIDEARGASASGAGGRVHARSTGAGAYGAKASTSTTGAVTPRDVTRPPTGIAAATTTDGDDEPRGPNRSALLVGAGVLVVLLLVGGIAMAMGGGGDGEVATDVTRPPPAAAETTTTSTTRRTTTTEATTTTVADDEVPVTVDPAPGGTTLPRPVVPPTPGPGVPIPPTVTTLPPANVPTTQPRVPSGVRFGVVQETPGENSWTTDPYSRGTPGKPALSWESYGDAANVRVEELARNGATLFMGQGPVGDVEVCPGGWPPGGAECAPEAGTYVFVLTYTIDGVRGEERREITFR